MQDHRADRYRSLPPSADDDHAREQHYPQQQSESDPLAELARLIGQSDPFSNFGLERQSAAPRQARAGRDSTDDDRQDSELPPPSPPSWMRRQRPASPQDEPHDSPDHSYDPLSRPEHEGWHSAPGYEQPSTFSPSLDQQQARYDDVRSRYDDVLYGQRPDDPQADPYGQDPGYDEHGYDQDDDYFDERADRPRRRGTLSIAAILALAVLGTAGAYAYRSFIGSPHGGEPPIIKADAEPNKIIPPAQSGEGKMIYDRVGDKAGERVVPREEQPVDVKSQPSNSAEPRIVFPPLIQNPAPPTTAALASAAPPAGAGSGNGILSGDEPRRIRTLSIRPDRPDIAVPTAGTPATHAAPKAAAASDHTSAAGNGPITLAPPQSAQHAGNTVEPRARVASANPAAAVPTAGGAYVQLASRRTEADAMNSYKILQGTYPGILGSRSSTVRRVDLGDKGVFYRTLVGPFASTEAATQFCVNLQSAGGQCIVQRN